ncbi:MAG: glycine--tRNA ligase [Oscillospiraceae bacterium]|nr:glycine--tRNA ligase [Oscillospiraceae bacterium]
MDKIVALCKSRGFVYPGSEIYGGLANSWDYGPLGVEYKNNLKRAWLKKFVQECPYNVGLDSAILMNARVWEASGHVVNFNDPLIDCKSCKMRHRADQLLEARGINPAGMTNERMSELIAQEKVPCPACGKSDFTPIRKFNMMFKTHQGVTDDSGADIYLRPETAQGIFVQFKNIQRTTRRKIPFGVAQIGKSFRNEITPGNFIFRIREFEQMELEFFCRPGTELTWFDYWRGFCRDWLLGLGMKSENLRLRDHDKEELSHYSNATTDFEFLFPFGWGELWGVASRTDFDLTAHQTHSGENMEYFDQESGERYIPFVIEPSLGADRAALAFLVDAFDEEDLTDPETGKADSRTVLRLHHALAPYKAAVLPLSKKLADAAQDVFKGLSKRFMTDYDESGSIGKRYRRQDEIGTPFCVTVDFDTLNDNAVTVRERDSMKQQRVPIDALRAYFDEKLEY